MPKTFSKYYVILIIFIVSGCSSFVVREHLDLFGIDNLKKMNVVDLTHTFDAEIPHWPGFINEKRTILYDHEPSSGTMGTGFLAEYYCHVGQWGTHIDPPIHFIKGGRTLDQISPKELVLPLIVIDISDQVHRDSDYIVQMHDVENWEKQNGKIPSASFVALRTDWSKNWPDKQKMRNEDDAGIAHYPGWSKPVLEYLIDEVGVKAIGHETIDTDPGIVASAGDYSLEYFVLSKDIYQIELMTNLDQVPQKGAIIFVGAPKPRNGSGFPVRVLAIYPK